jgi:sigma-54 dependent transcriptional regulator, acetoin dehydrogenase operon transcriptional activator AcoR
MQPVKELKNINQFLQQVTGAFADVVDMELGVIDRDLEVIAGTGFFEKEVGMVYREGCMTDKLLLSPEETAIFVQDTKSSNNCRDCNTFEHCEVLAFLMCPITYLGGKIGTLSLLALNEVQRQKLIHDSQKLQRFLNNLSNFIAITLNEKKMGMKVNSLANQVKAVINFVHEGIIAINADGFITNINHSAQSMLETNEDMRSKHISDLFPGFNPQALIRGNSSQSGSQYYEQELQYVTADHIELLLYCNITLMHEDNRVTGAVLSFRRKEELKKLASRIIGEEMNIPSRRSKGTSQEITEIKTTMKRVANTDSTLLIRGETGTGKSLFARAVHQKSYRRNKPFVTVNCASIPATLLESELFGYEEGAFTGAKKGGKPGKFEIAHEGTLFLDEIGDMPLSSQVKLLQVIETRRVERVGGVKSRGLDVRIIAATNQDLESLIEKEKFRKDLFYRLNVIPFFIPPLRERREDITLLIHYFLDFYNKQLHKDVKRFQERAREILFHYPWPGNVRELENAIEYAVNIETGPEITPESLPGKVVNYRHDDELSHTYSLDYLEKTIIGKALKKYGTSTQGKERAAAALGISRATLYRKLKKFNLNVS